MDGWLRSLLSMVVVSAVALGAACGDEGGDGDRLAVERYVVGVRAAGAANATVEPGLPVSGGGALALDVGGPGSGITGGSSTYAVSAEDAAAYRELLIGVDGVDGLWRLVLAADATAADVIVTFAAAPPRLDFDLAFLPVDGSGGTGTVANVAVTLIEVGTGELQVSLSWDTETDVDLHVVEPGGEEIYYSNETSESGGTLDLDSNAGCTIDDVNNENVTWERGAPRGEYIVRVDYWSACSVPGTTQYVVTVRSRTGTPATYQGTFEAADETGGGLGDGVEVARFTY